MNEHQPGKYKVIQRHSSVQKNKKQQHMKGEVNFDQLVSSLQVLMKSTMEWINTLKAL